MVSDGALMQAICQGDEHAFAELYDRYGPRMHRFFYRMLWRDAETAQDFTQELFVKIIENPRQYDPKRSFSTWFYAVAMNMCKNEYRRRGRCSSKDDTSETNGEPEAALFHNLDRPVFQQHLQLALDQLELPQRSAFILRYQEELSLREIAEIENCPEGTVKSRLHYALKNLAGYLEYWKQEIR